MARYTRPWAGLQLRGLRALVTEDVAQRLETVADALRSAGEWPSLAVADGVTSPWTWPRGWTRQAGSRSTRSGSCGRGRARRAAP